MQIDIFALWRPFEWCYERPYLALIPAVFFTIGFIWVLRARRPYRQLPLSILFLTAALWFSYAAWEYHVSRTIKSEDVPIRIDLFLIVPTLYVCSFFGALALVIHGLTSRRIEIDATPKYQESSPKCPSD